MKTQKAEIRIVIRDGIRIGLYWQANCKNLDFYYGPPHTSLGPILRGSYHKSGASHLHLPQEKKVGRIQLPAPGSLKKPIRLVEQGAPLKIKWGYNIKDDNITRKTLVFDITNKDKKYLPCVEFWVIPHGQDRMINDIISKREGWGDVLLGNILIKKMSPWLLAIVWVPSRKTRNAIDKALSGSAS